MMRVHSGTLKSLSYRDLFEFPEINFTWLVGGIISVAVINHDVQSYKFRTILKDSFDLILIAIAILIIAAFVEVFLTTLIYSFKGLVPLIILVAIILLSTTVIFVRRKIKSAESYLNR